jgi:adenosylmethionine-8-amino-7-oxononanoate aminotransferase
MWRSPFDALLFDPIRLAAPAFPLHRHSETGANLGHDCEAADAAISVLEKHRDELAAIVIEPIVQCAGKMKMTGTGFSRRVSQYARDHGIHVISDEIAVGFGRTGRLFASEWVGVRPDFLCLGKALSGGILPLACVLVGAGIESGFSEDPSKTFLHSHSFAGHALGCAAGLASLGVLHSEVLPNLKARITAFHSRIEAVAAHCPQVSARRQAGMIAAFDLATPKGDRSQTDPRIGFALRRAAMRRGVLLRPLNNTLYWMPPLLIADEELDHLAQVTTEVIEEVIGT